MAKRRLRKTDRRTFPGPEEYELEAMKTFADAFFDGGRPSEGVTHAVARYLRRAFFPAPPQRKDAPFWTQRRMERWRMSGEVRMLLLGGAVRSANAAFDKVGEKYDVSSDTVSRAFSEMDGFAHLATDVPAYRRAIEDAVARARKDKPPAS